MSHAVPQSPQAWANRYLPIRDAVKLGGLRGDDSYDNTASFAALLTAYRTLYLLTAGTYRMGKFSIPSNTHLFLAPGVILKDTGALSEVSLECLCNIVSVSNVSIVGHGAKLLMTRADYVTGEHRHGCTIRDATNVRIEGLESSNTGGDGFYVGGGGDNPCYNVKLLGVIADNNRRQGLSITSCRGLRVIDGRFTNTNGTAPAAGIDIEPNAGTDLLDDVVIVRPYLYNNAGGGLTVFLGSFASGYCDVRVIDPICSLNSGGGSISGRRRGTIELNRCPTTNAPKGRVLISGVQIKDAYTMGIAVYDWDSSGPDVVILDPRIDSCNMQRASIEGAAVGNHFSCPISMVNSGSYTTVPGNVRVVRPVLRDTAGYVVADGYSALRTVGTGWNECTVQDAKVKDMLNWAIDAGAGDIQFDNNDQIEVAITGNTTMSDGRYLGKVVTNFGASGGLAFTLPAAGANFNRWVMNFAVRADQTFAIVPNAADKIKPLADVFAAATVIRCSMPGGRISLQCLQQSAGVYVWMVVRIAGVWAIDPGAGDVPVYTTSNVSTTRTLDANTGVAPGALYAEAVADATVDAVDVTRDVLGTLIKDLRERGIVG